MATRVIIPDDVVRLRTWWDKGLPMGDATQAKPEHAPLLGDLYSKAFNATGFKQLTTSEKRDELIIWLQGLCEAENLWFISDDKGPVVLGHYDADRDEIITIATRDGMERRGYGEKMLKALLAKYRTLKVRPVTRGGKALATKCGFAPSPTDESLWVKGP